jgi:hypothetical protein
MTRFEWFRRAVAGISAFFDSMPSRQQFRNGSHVNSIGMSGYVWFVSSGARLTWTYFVGPKVELVRRDYVGNEGWETFLSYEDPAQDILIGLLRLRKLTDDTFRPELIGGCSMVRELHVYGSVVPVNARDPTKFQHQVNEMFSLWAFICLVKATTAVCLSL